MQEGIDERADQLDRVVKDYAWWNEAVEAIQLRRDRDWAEARLGAYLYGTHAYDWAFVVAPDGSTFHAAFRGEVVAKDVTSALGNQLWRKLVDDATAAVKDGEPYSVHAFLPMRDGGLGIGSAAAIMPETSWTEPQPAGAPFVLVVVRSLEANWFSELATALDMRDLNFVPTGVRLGRHCGFQCVALSRAA